MSTNFTPELVQDIAVRVVTQFMTKQAGLSEAIAIEAKTLELNPEQIKRVIEASNTIAYLRQLEDAKDRSFEFPVAEYRDVMGHLVLPTNKSPTVNSVVEPVASPLVEKLEVTKTASMPEQEKIAMLIKETLRVKQTMNKLAEEGYLVTMSLEKYASILQKDPQGFEKLAYVAPEEDLGSLSILCSFEKMAGTGSVFTTLELKDALALVHLFKEAKDMANEYDDMETFIKRASNILIEKKAFAPLGAAAETIGKVLGSVPRYAGKGLWKTIKGVGAGVAALSAGKTIGQRLERSADIGASAIAGASTTHDNPVWSSIHG
jgi:hypothetical protein